VKQMHGDEVVWIARKLVLEQRVKRLAHRRRLDEPQKHAANRFQHTVDTLHGDAGAKRSVQN